MCSVTRGWAVGTCGRRLWLWAGTPACATRPTSPFSRRARPNGYRCARWSRDRATCGWAPVGTGRGLPRRASGRYLGTLGRGLQAYGQAQPWVLLTDTPVAQTEPTLYACRNWIDQGFRGLKTVGDPWSALARPTQSWVVTPESSRSPYSCQDLESAPAGHPARLGQRRACSKHNGDQFHVQVRDFCGN